MKIFFSKLNSPFWQPVPQLGTGSATQSYKFGACTTLQEVPVRQGVVPHGEDAHSFVPSSIKLTNNVDIINFENIFHKFLLFLI